MVEVLWAALLVMTAIAAWLAWKLDERTSQLDQCTAYWQELYDAHHILQLRNEALEKESLDFADFKREVEEEGSVDTEVARLRNANSRLAVQLDWTTLEFEQLCKVLAEADGELLREALQTVQENMRVDYGDN
jgi:hypothetical protein